MHRFMQANDGSTNTNRVVFHALLLPSKYDWKYLENHSSIMVENQGSHKFNHDQELNTGLVKTLRRWNTEQHDANVTNTFNTFNISIRICLWQIVILMLKVLTNNFVNINMLPNIHIRLFLWDVELKNIIFKCYDNF